MKDSSDDHQVQINKVLHRLKYVKCSVTSDANGLKDAVGGLLKGVANGDFMTAITGTVGIALDSLLGNYSGNSSEVTSSTVSVGPLGNFTKIDYDMFSYQYTSKALMDIAQNVVCVAVIISSVKTDNLDKTDVDNLLVMSFGDLPQDQLQSLQKQTYAALGRDDSFNVINKVQAVADDDKKEDAPEEK